MDGVVAGGADHEGSCVWCFAMTCAHAGRGLSWGGELRQLGDVVHLHLAGVLTHLALSSEEPGDQLLVVDGGRDELAVGEDRVALPSQR